MSKGRLRGDAARFCTHFQVALGNESNTFLDTDRSYVGGVWQDCGALGWGIHRSVVKKDGPAPAFVLREKLTADNCFRMVVCVDGRQDIGQGPEEILRCTQHDRRGRLPIVPRPRRHGIERETRPQLAPVLARWVGDTRGRIVSVPTAVPSPRIPLGRSGRGIGAR